MLPTKPYLLLDAGGTLVFPDQAFLLEQVKRHGVHLTHAELYQAYCRLIHNLDQRLRENGRSRPAWPGGYVAALLDWLGVAGPPAEAIIEAAQARHERRSLWAFTFDWVGEALAQLADQGYRMSVISNSDGRTEALLADAGLARFLERIFDSRLMGVEKPDPAIFQIALEELGLSPTEALYTGDVYYYDVVGANRAGLGCVHLDPAGLYDDWPGVHLPDIRHLSRWLARYEAEPEKFELWPAGTRGENRPPPGS